LSEKAAAEKAAVTVWELSQREKNIIARLSGKEQTAEEDTAQLSLFVGDTE
jgi:hypothetical protein